jgi:hypothetical protein
VVLWLVSNTDKNNFGGSGMVKELEIMIDYEKISCCKNVYSKNLNPDCAIDKRFIANSELKNTLENYTLLINPELTGKYLEIFQKDLKQDILEYFEDKEVDNSAGTLAQIAYLRLSKATNQFILEQSIKGNTDEIKKKAIKYKNEYDIISYLL